MMSIQDRTIKEVFEFGFEEMEFKQFGNNKTYLYHRNDMKQFYNYTISKFEKEFAGSLSFR